MINKQSYQIQGMRQDNLVGTGFSSKFAHEIKNLRLNTIGDYTTACWTTEKGTKEVEVSNWQYSDNGRNVNYRWITNIKTYVSSVGQEDIYETLEVEDFQPIGQAVINDNWVIFGTIEVTDAPKYDPQTQTAVKTHTDSIIICLNYYVNNNEEKLRGRVLYQGNLGFSAEHPIETTVFYENEKLQKVYWVDGVNQPRMINIKGAEKKKNGFNSDIFDNNTATVDTLRDDTQFDFVRELDLTENIQIEKLQGSNGLFPPCTVKYAFTYYKEFGQESNIVATSTLVYPTKGERGCSPDELSSDAFRVLIGNITENTKNRWDYIRLYSIIRTSADAKPIVRIVDSKKLSEAEQASGGSTYAISFVDTNTTGRIIDPDTIYYLGGRNCVVETIEQKDNTLFYGNIKLNTKSVTDLNLNLSKEVRFVLNTENNSSEYKEIQFADINNLGFYSWVNQLNKATNPKIFKYGEHYKVGIQFQDKYGIWSEILPVSNGYIQNDSQLEWGVDSAKFAIIKYQLDAGKVSTLKSNGYKRARLAVCYPDNTNRRVIAQGTLCPTLANKKWSMDNTPDRVSSWFYRFKEPYYGDNDDNTIIPLGEVQSMNVRKDMENQTKDDKFKRKYYTQDIIPRDDNTRDDLFFIRFDTCTLHSSDIEFDESIRTLNLTDCDLRILGYTYPTAYAHKVYLDYSKKAIDYHNNSGKGFVDNAKNEKNTLTSGIINNRSVTFANNYTGNDYDIIKKEYGYWEDINVYNSNFLKKDSAKYQIGYDLINYNIYPFQRKYLNNYMGDLTIRISVDQALDFDTTIHESSIINSKVWSNLNFSLKEYFITNTTYTPVDIKIFDTKEVNTLRIKKKSSIDEEDSFYFGNLDTLVPLCASTNLPTSAVKLNMGLRRWSSSSRNYFKTVTDAAESEVERNTNCNTFSGRYDIDFVQQLHMPYGEHQYDNSKAEAQRIGVSSDPIQMRYKSTPHAVLTFTSINGGTGHDNDAWNLRNLIHRQNSDCVLLTELYRDVPIPSSTTNNLNDIYIPCSTSYPLPNSGNLILYHDEGDTYFMRYDNLKTYPYASDDVNQIVEIYSFMCETRVNLDGRYDENRGLTDNTIVNNTNFNLINKSYNQTDNIFSYTELDKLSAGLDNFPNQITFSNPKVIGDEIDTWTNITLASTVDANGNLGKITKIENINNNLILFQEHGIARIKYNENTAIATTDGEPLELAKTNKLDGIDYVNTSIGCQNKWSISNTKNGLFWIDDSRQELLTYNGQSMESFSSLTGMESFMIKQLPTVFKKWTPSTFDNFVTYYDKLSNDIYYINKDYCLAWNEEAKAFTSFYSYNRVPYMINLANHSLMWKSGVWAAREADTYSTFFNNNKPEDYWMTVVCDGQTDKGSAFPADKVFNNIEYRADVYNLDGTNTNYATSVFNKKQAWNGYQDSGECSLDGIRKFNTWRVQLPRHQGTRDRIRNPFCYIKLKQDNTSSGRESTQTDRMILHDLAVYFDMR